MATLPKFGLTSAPVGIVSAPLQETDRIPCQIAQANIGAGDFCQLIAGGWAPAATPAPGLRMAWDSAQAGQPVTLLEPRVRVRYSDPAGAITPGTLYFLDGTNAGAVNSAAASGLADPSVAPVPAIGGAGTIATGTYTLGYVDRDASGSTRLSPTANVTMDGSHLIHLPALPLAAGAVARDYYMSRSAGSSDLALAATDTTGAAFDISAVPVAGAAEPPDVNGTAAAANSIPLMRALANSKGQFEGVFELL